MNWGDICKWRDDVDGAVLSVMIFYRFLIASFYLITKYVEGFKKNFFEIWPLNAWKTWNLVKFFEFYCATIEI